MPRIEVGACVAVAESCMWVGGLTSSAGPDKGVMTPEMQHDRALKRSRTNACNNSATPANLNHVDPAFSINAFSRDIMPSSPSKTNCKSVLFPTTLIKCSFNCMQMILFA